MIKRSLTKIVSRLSLSPHSVRHTSSTFHPPAFYIPKDKMPSTMSITFLGTSSGGGPSMSRNCSSLVADLLGNGTLWMVDCAEGTLRQFQLQPYSPDRSNARLTQVKKIFITHMHVDHVMGIVPILRSVLFPVPVGQDAAQIEALRKNSPAIEIYGPAGIRAFIRSILKMTFSRMADKYVVHELLTPTDEVTSCEPEAMHLNEVAGHDILCSEDGTWREIAQQKGTYGSIVVDAGPIAHRDPCIGYIFREAAKPYRKIVVLGDTSDPSTIVPLCINPSPSLLIHEATDAHIPQDIDPKAKRPYDTVKEKALARGHSLPEMAGAFAKTIGAQKLVLNHIGGRFPAPHPNESHRLKGIRANVIAEIERQASEAWGMGTARAAWDFMRVAIPASGEADVSISDMEYPTSYNTAGNSRAYLNHGAPSFASSGHRSGGGRQHTGSRSWLGNVDGERNHDYGHWGR